MAGRAAGKNSGKPSAKAHGLKPQKTLKKFTRKELPQSVVFPAAEDSDFPRGGASVLSREERAEARAEAEIQFEREERNSRKGKDRKSKKKKSSSGGVDDELGSLFGDGISGKLPRFANRITLKNVAPKMKLWGVIIEVNEKDLLISLPGGLKGFVRAEEVSDKLIDCGNKASEGNSLSNLFKVGQLVSCIVLQVDDDKKEAKGNKRIWLSLRLSFLYKGLTLDAVQDGMVLNAQVKSVEDHGYILYFGVSSFTGFLPRNEKDNCRVTAGQLLQCVVKEIDKARAIAYVVSDRDLVSKCVASDLKGLSIDLLVPGMMVNARVHSVLENGVMLSFLTYFTGTVDIYHLHDAFPDKNWKDYYKQNKKVHARILFIDPSTRAVGLTLSSRLLNNEAPITHVRTGEIYDNTRIVRVDRGVGLLLEIPSSPEPSPAFVSIFDVADEVVSKLEKKFEVGSYVRTRVLGMRHLEGLAIATLRDSAFEGSVFTHSDVKPGMLVKAKVISVDNFGAIVQFPSGVKALCPLRHMSELDIVKPPKKFKVGVELLFSVLGCKSKRITVTHKKTLVKSKLSVIASYADATEGLIAHGWIAKIEKHGCFVRFYNGVQGFARRSELALEPGSEADEVYHVGQVVKCRILGTDPSSRRISISFVTSSKRTSDSDMPKLGCVVSGVVERLTPTAVIVQLNGYAGLKGTIFNEHLADLKGHATLFKSLLKPGYEFDQLLVLDYEGNSLVVSAKYSLINSPQQIPSDISQIQPNSLVNGYICNIIETGCFVRFLGRLTGFSPKRTATDEQIDDLLDAFYTGQSVRSNVLNVDSNSGRIKLSLKATLCSSLDATFIEGYFLFEEKVAAIQMSSDLSWAKNFQIGSLIEGVVQEKKEYGAVVGFKDYPDVVGVVTNYQLGGVNIEVRSVVKAMILDIAKLDGLVDLSLKPELVKSALAEGSKKKRRRNSLADIELHETVNAVVEIVKENYLVLSIPKYNNALGYASMIDYNTEKLPHYPFTVGQSIIAIVAAIPEPMSAGRLLLHLNSLTNHVGVSSSKKARTRSLTNMGELVEAEVIEIRPLELILKFGSGLHGRIHITEVLDNEDSMEYPLSKFSVGQLLTARIIAKNEQSRNHSKGYQWELSLRPSVIAGKNEAKMTNTSEEFCSSLGSTVRGYVTKVDSDWIWLTLSRSIMAHVYILDTSCEPVVLQEFQKHYSVGQALQGQVISINKDKKLLRLTVRPFSLLIKSQVDENVTEDIPGSKTSDVSVVEHISEGDVVGGKIKKILPGVGGILVQIGPHLVGRAHYCELVDSWVPDPLSDYHEGQFVKCKVLEITRSSETSLRVDLSLRSSSHGGHTINLDKSSQQFERIDDIHPDMKVQGYVKNVTTKGCFIMLSRTVDARILLSNLSDVYIDNPQKEFPIGKLVLGRVLSVEPSSKRVEVTLKTLAGSEIVKSDIEVFNKLLVGDIVSGQIKRVESFGLFIAIDKIKMVGLCHISEISDNHIDNIPDKYKEGDKVVAKVLKIDETRQRIRLGMKSSYLNDLHTTPESAVEEEHTVFLDSSFLVSQPNENSIQSKEMVEYNYDDDSMILPQAEKRASAPPLNVVLDDDISDLDNALIESHENADSKGALTKMDEKHRKRKVKEEKELETSALEERRIQQDMPRTEDEFEILVRTSPNSSYVWIKYMEHMLSLAEVEKARAIAERALRTINFREEGEKLNIWIAYFNLENEYGSPPDEAVKKIFQRAMQYCDAKTVHLALLGLYERTEQQGLADELLNRMTKKFKHSCKVWVHSVQNSLKKGSDISDIVKYALLSLPRKKHIKFLSKTAILHFKSDAPDRGRLFFEQMLREYPKRTDLWSLYLDQEMSLKDSEIIRSLFERATCLSLPPKKMKFLFKKYLDYEKAYGDEETVEHVKKKALEFVQSSLS